MPLNSMTGFARTDGDILDIRWYWEIRSVNGKGLDIRYRGPQGFETLEQSVRELCGKKLSRGNCSINLFVKRETPTSEVRINQDVLQEILKTIQANQSLLSNFQPATVDGILSLKGVMDVAEAEDSEEQLVTKREALFSSFQEVLEQFCKARAEEGSRLQQILKDQVENIAAIVSDIETSPSRTPEKIAKKLAEQIKRLFDADNRLELDRLHQEAAILATKADVTEEIDRLKGHITAANELLNASKPIGRKFDFLTQEFNREVNTICSKSNDSDVTRLGLEAKAIVDQMREQVQNIE